MAVHIKNTNGYIQIHSNADAVPDMHHLMAPSGTVTPLISMKNTPQIITFWAYAVLSVSNNALINRATEDSPALVATS